MRPLVLVFSLFALLGYYCSAVKGDSGGFGETGTGMETGDSIGEEEPGICGLYSGFPGPSTVSAYQSPAEWAAEHGQSGAWSQSLADWAEAEGAVTFTLVQTGVIEANGYEEYTTTQRVAYRCDTDGMWLVSSRYEYSYTYNGNPYSGWSELSYSEPLLVLRPGLVVGSTWSATVQALITTSSGGSQESELSYGFEVAAEEEVTVPAGTFTTLKLVSTADGAAAWLDAEAGLVRTDGRELVSWSR